MKNKQTNPEWPTKREAWSQNRGRPHSSEPKQPRCTLQWQHVKGKSCLRKGFGCTKASTQLLEMLQAYARLPLRPAVHERRPRGACNALLFNNVTRRGTMCTYVTSQLFLRRRFSQPPRAHHIPPAHCCSFRRSLSADFGLFLGVSSRTWRGEETLTQGTIKFRSGKLRALSVF